MKSLNIQIQENISNVLVIYKNCLVRHFGRLDLFRRSFEKPLREFKKSEILWKECIETSFEVYDEIKKNFGHLPYVARSFFPEPFIYLIPEVLSFIKKEYVNKFLNLAKVKENLNILKKKISYLNEEAIDELVDFVIEKEKEGEKGEAYFAVKKFCKEYEFGKIYFQLFEKEYLLRKELKKVKINKKIKKGGKRWLTM